MAKGLTETILDAFQYNPLGDAARNIFWLCSASQVVHFLGMSVMAGALLIIDLRILGFIRQTDHRTVEKLIPIAVLGFVLNAVSGVTMFTADPYMYWPNPVFKLKVAAIVIAGVNAVWFAVLTSKNSLAQVVGGKKLPLMKVAAVLSLLSWTLVILFGRLLPTFEVAN